MSDTLSAPSSVEGPIEFASYSTRERKSHYFIPIILLVALVS